MKKSHGFTLIIFIFLLPEIISAGAWPQRKGTIYFKLSSSYLFTTKEFNHTGAKLNIFQERIIYEDTSFRDFAVTSYVEYGLTEKLTLISNIPFKILTSKRTELIGGGALLRIATLHTLGFSDFSMSARYSLINRGFAFSVQGGIKLPLGYESKPDDDGAPLGTGKIDFEANLLIGRSLYPLPVYLTGGIGYRRRSGPLHDQVLLTAETGWQSGRFLLKTTFDAIKSTVAPPDIVGQPVISPLPGGGGALPNIIVGDQDIFKLSPSLIFKFDQWFSLQAELLHIFAGKNTVAGSIYSLGLIFER